MEKNYDHYLTHKLRFFAMKCEDGVPPHCTAYCRITTALPTTALLHARYYALQYPMTDETSDPTSLRVASSRLLV